MREIKDLAIFYLVGLWSRRWSVAGVAWLVCLAGWLYIALLPPQYTARATIYVDTQSILGPLMRGLAVEADIEQQLLIMRQTLLSRPNVEQLIREAGLDLDPDLDPSPAARTNLIDRLQRDIRIGARNKTLFDVSYTHNDASTAFRVVDTILQIFVEQNMGTSQRDVESARSFIDKQIEDYEQRLRDADLAVAAFRRENADKLGSLERLKSRLSMAQSQLAQLRAELDSAVWQRDQLTLELRSTPPTVTAADLSPGPSPAEQRLTDLQRRLDELRQVFTDRHPDVVALRSLIAEARNVVAGERRGATPELVRPNPVHEQLQAELRVAERRLTELRERIASQETDVEELSVEVTENPAVAAELTRLTRDYEIIHDQYRELVQRRETAQLAERLRSETNNVEFRLVDPPIVPTQPSGPPYSLMMLGVVVVAFGAGGSLAFLRVQLDPAITSAHQLREQFDLPVLGALSVVRSAPARRWRWVEQGLLVGFVCVPLVASGALFVLYDRPVPPNLAEVAKDAVAARGGELSRLF